MDPTKVLVTGGTGFLGTFIVEALLATKRYQVTAVDINPPSLGTSTFSDVRYVRANMLQPEELQKVFNEAKPAIVIHTVGVYPLGQARYSMKGKKLVFDVNVEGTRNVIEASKACGAKGLVYTSSVTVLIDELDRDFINADETWSTGRAQTLYGQSKTIAENLVLSASAPDFFTCALRAAPMFGPKDPGTLPILHALIARGETHFIVGSGINLQDYVYVGNVADAHVLAAANLLNSGTAAGEAFFITNGEPITARDFCLAIWKEFGHVPKWEVRIPEGLAWWVGLGVEWTSWLTGTKGTFSRGMVCDATKWRYLSIAKAKRILGYEPKVGLEEGIRISCQHYQQQANERKRN